MPNMEPTFHGFIDTTHDALVLLEACNQQQCDRVTRRMAEKERQHITSGSVYVFDEEESRIKRWTDGRMWSPSRILGNFLVYRELDRRHPEEETTTAGVLTKAEEERLYGGGSDEVTVRGGRQRERSLVGSLTSTYKFKKGGLVKKTLSVGTLHLICYYCVEDVLGQRLRTPSSLPELLAFSISASLLAPSCFRVPPKIDYAPDGTPTFVAERDENAPHRPSGSRSSIASTSSSLISPPISVNTSDYFSFAGDGAGSAPSSASSLGEPRLGSSGSGSHDQSPRPSLSHTSRNQNLSGGATRNGQTRNRHSPYSTNRTDIADMQFPEMADDGMQQYEAYRGAETFSPDQHIFYQPAYGYEGLLHPTANPQSEEHFSNYASSLHAPPSGRNSISSFLRPYTSYDPIPNGPSPASADFSRSLSDNGRTRERAFSGPNPVISRQDTHNNNHTSWHSENGLHLRGMHTTEFLHPAGEQMAYQGSMRSHSSTINGRHPPTQFASSYPSPLSSHFSIGDNYSMSQPIDRPPSPRTILPPNSSPFCFNPPPAPHLTQEFGGNAFSFSNVYQGDRRPSYNDQDQFPRPSGLVRPIPYTLHQRPYEYEHDIPTQDSSSRQHVPIWLQQQQPQSTSDR